MGLESIPQQEQSSKEEMVFPLNFTTLLHRNWYRRFWERVPMLNNANGFKKIYIATGYTDLRRGMEGLAAIIRFQFNLDPYDKDTLFLFCGKRTASCFCTSGFTAVHSSGHGQRTRQKKSRRINTRCWCRDLRSLQSVPSSRLKIRPVQCDSCCSICWK